MSDKPIHLKSSLNQDVAMIAADAAIALRILAIALIGIKNGDEDLVLEKLTDIVTQADKLWARFENLTQSEGDDD